MFNPFYEVPNNPAARRAHVAALKNLNKENADKELFDHLYGNLSILDAKSSSLLSFNSIIAAVFAIFMTNTGAAGRESWAIYAGMAAILISSFLLLLVEWVHWSSTEDLSTPEHLATGLLGLRRTRTIAYRLAWCLSVFALLALAIFFALPLAPTAS